MHETAIVEAPLLCVHMDWKALTVMKWEYSLCEPWPHNYSPIDAFQTLCFDHLGFADVEVFDVLDGQHLAPHQALVRPDDWQRLWLTMKEPWSTQRSAYRRAFKGTAAPVLRVGLEPHFRTMQIVAGSMVKHTSVTSNQYDTAISDGGGLLPIRGTFVQFCPSAEVAATELSARRPSLDDIYAKWPRRNKALRQVSLGAPPLTKISFPTFCAA